MNEVENSDGENLVCFTSSSLTHFVELGSIGVEMDFISVLCFSVENCGRLRIAYHIHHCILNVG